MYLKKIDGPRAVTLPDGSAMTQADLPPVKTRRWVASRKAAVVKGILAGLITETEAKSRWSLSEGELDEWLFAVQNHGIGALKTTMVQKYRQP
ncbi:MAG: DUF1153 domain-containing protein [Paracoccaceae bacterium]